MALVECFVFLAIILLAAIGPDKRGPGILKQTMMVGGSYAVAIVKLLLLTTCHPEPKRFRREGPQQSQF